ncbi:MAG: hypothetical protein SF053_19345 [Bacteroidia bacterium]|nr:hypothetical protein [Bacteroidia bacterium]
MDNRYMSQEYQDSHFEVDQQLDIPAATPWRYGAGVQLTQMGLKGLGYSFGGVNEYQLTYLEFIPAQVNYEISPLLHVGVGAGLSRLVRADLNGQVVNDLSADGYNGWEHNLFLEFGVGNSTHGFQGGLRTQLRNTYLNREQAAYGAVQVYAGYRLGQNTKRN